MSGNGTNFIAFACGMKRSGKSYLLAQLAKRFPRRIVFDFIGEYADKIPNAYEATTLQESVKALLDARAGGNVWTVLCNVEPEEVPKILAALAPNNGKPESSFARAVGGVVIECGEVDLIAPNSQKCPREVKNIFQRGRHYGISALVATQRPRDVHRVVTSQSDMIAAFRQHEPRDAEYLGNVMRSDAVELLQGLRPRNYLRYLVNYGRLEIVNENGQTIKTED